MKQYRREMAGVAVNECSVLAVELREECGNERCNWSQVAQVAIDLRSSPSWVGGMNLALQKTGEVREPHACRKTLTRDVSNRRKDLWTLVREHYEVSGKIVGGEHLAGELHTSLL